MICEIRILNSQSAYSVTHQNQFLLRAIPFEKLGEGMSASGFSDYPPPEFPNFWGYPPPESQFFSYHPPAESTKWLGLPLPALFTYPLLFLYMKMAAKTSRKVGVE